FDVMLPVRSGSVVVTAIGDEHDMDEVRVSLAADREAAVVLTLPRLFGVLHLESDPAGEAPLVDGAVPADCPATPCDARVVAGAHHVAFGGDLYVPWASDVAGDSDASPAVSANLER